MKRVALTCGLCVVLLTGRAQKKLSIEECYSLAQQNYPLVKQRELISKSKAYTLENASRGYLPQLTVNGQASYQSAVTQLPLKIAGTDIPTLSKDQYKLYAEVTQTILDGGVIKAQQQAAEANALLEEERLAAELYKLKERVNQLFFGILMVDEQLKQTAIVRSDIQLGVAKTNAAIANGAALKSSADVWQAELLKTDQRTVELRSLRLAFIDMLALFLNQPLAENTLFQKPVPVVTSADINRHELGVIEQQKKLIDAQAQLINTRHKPKVSLFFQGGFGRPALNLLNNDFTSYYIGGLRLSWAVTAFYTQRSEHGLLNVNRSLLDVQRETFLFNTNVALKQQNAEISKLQELSRMDAALLALRSRIKSTALAQVENGVINTNDYLREVNAEDMARQNQLLHEIQLIMALYNQQTTAGN